MFVDIGCNVGGASYAAWLAGSRVRFGHTKPVPTNYAIGRQNIGRLAGARSRNAAVVGAGRPKNMGFPVGNDSFFLPDHPLVHVETMTLDEILVAIGKPVRFLKIDCEGSEWEILYTCTKLDQIREIKGEFHEPCPNWYALQQDAALPNYDRHTLAVVPEWLGIQHDVRRAREVGQRAARYQTSSRGCFTHGDRSFVGHPHAANHPRPPSNPGVLLRRVRRSGSVPSGFLATLSSPR